GSAAGTSAKSRPSGGACARLTGLGGRAAPTRSTSRATRAKSRNARSGSRRCARPAFRGGSRPVDGELTERSRRAFVPHRGRGPPKRRINAGRSVDCAVLLADPVVRWRGGQFDGDPEPAPGARDDRQESVVDV